jgi:DNA-binding MarR family transcriptional regulator
MPEAEPALAAFLRLERAVAPVSFQELAELDLTMAQLKAVMVLHRSGPVTIGRFAEAVGTKLPAASVFVDRLEQAGLAVRREDGEDRRRVVIEMTERAARMAARLRGGRERVAAAIQRMAPEARDALARGIEALADELERERDALDPPMEVPTPRP